MDSRIAGTKTWKPQPRTDSPAPEDYPIVVWREASGWEVRNVGGAADGRGGSNAGPFVWFSLPKMRPGGPARSETGTLSPIVLTNRTAKGETLERVKGYFQSLHVKLLAYLLEAPLPEGNENAAKLIGLETQCPKCAGTGTLMHPEWKAWWARSAETPPKHFPIPSVPERIHCTQCKGKGTVPAPSGEALLDFIRKYL